MRRLAGRVQDAASLLNRLSRVARLLIALRKCRIVSLARESLFRFD
jgi:hypothetical protein